MIAGVILAAVVLLLAAFFYWQNNSIQVDEYAVESPALPPELSGCRIVQLSDLHNKAFGPDQKRLAEVLEKLEPDLILITGDLIDKRRTREDAWDNALSAVRQAAELAPVFYVSGNHEWQSGLYRKLRPQLETIGAEVLDDGFTVLDHGDTAMTVMGLSDPAAFSKSVKSGKKMQKEELPACAKKVRERLQWLCGQQEESTFQVLVSHRPQLLGMYAEAGVHLVFCGHAHGGQVRLPGLGALYAPDQGFRPQFTEGPYIEGDTVMIVSRGLGNSGCPLRVFNRPNVVAVTLNASEEEEDAPDSGMEPGAIFEEPAEEAAEPEETETLEETAPAEALVEQAEEMLETSEDVPETEELSPEAEEATSEKEEELPETAEEAPVTEEEELPETEEEEAVSEEAETVVAEEEAPLEQAEMPGLGTMTPEMQEIISNAEEAFAELEENLSVDDEPFPQPKEAAASSEPLSMEEQDGEAEIQLPPGGVLPMDELPGEEALLAGNTPKA